MSITLGEKLRQAREERGISISEVAEQTRISPMYIESIEGDNYKPLPGGIFNKGFVKAYAKYVGLDEQEALQDYARLVAQHEDTVEDTHPRYRPEVLTDDARSASSIVPTVVFAAIILALMTVGILFAVNYIRNQPSGPAVVSNTSSNTAGNSGNAALPVNSNPEPVPDGIRVEFRALSEKVSVQSTVDGTVASDEILPETPKVYTAQQAIKLRYYRGFADKVQITLNGKPLAPPTLPAKGNIEIEINRENVSRIYESGQLTPGAPAVAATATPVPTPIATATVTATPAPTVSTPATPRPRATTPRPAFTPASTPRRTPTPIVVGRPTATPN